MAGRHFGWLAVAVSVAPSPAAAQISAGGWTYGQVETGCIARTILVSGVRELLIEVSGSSLNLQLSASGAAAPWPVGARYVATIGGVRIPGLIGARDKAESVLRGEVGAAFAQALGHDNDAEIVIESEDGTGEARRVRVRNGRDAIQSLGRCNAARTAAIAAGKAPIPANRPFKANFTLAGLLDREDFSDDEQFDRAGPFAARLAYDNTGRVTSCTVTRTSFLPAVDAALCRALRSKARFQPATDAQSRLIPGSYEYRDNDLRRLMPRGFVPRQ